MEPTFDLSNPKPGSILDAKYLDADYVFSEGLNIVQVFFRQETWSGFKALLAFLSLFFITIIFYSAIRLFEIRRKEHKHLAHEIAEYARRMAEKERSHLAKREISKNERWVKVLELMTSVNSADWKLAIIEADAILESLLTELGFTGESLGDKLRSANQENFKNLSLAWEAHGVRNRIAHEGENFILSSHETRRVLALYEHVFRTYGYI